MDKIILPKCILANLCTPCSTDALFNMINIFIEFLPHALYLTGFACVCGLSGVQKDILLQRSDCFFFFSSSSSINYKILNLMSNFQADDVRLSSNWAICVSIWDLEEWFASSWPLNLCFRDLYLKSCQGKQLHKLLLHPISKGGMTAPLILPLNSSVHLHFATCYHRFQDVKTDEA